MSLALYVCVLYPQVLALLAHHRHLKMTALTSHEARHPSLDLDPHLMSRPTPQKHCQYLVFLVFSRVKKF